MSSDVNVIEHLAHASRFGTQTRLAKAAGVRPHTITGKKGSNSLTHAQMRRILISAPKMGVSISPDDFFPEFHGSPEGAHPVQVPRKPRRQRAA